MKRRKIIKELRLKDVAPIEINNELVYKRVWEWLDEDPLSLWKATKRIYSKGKRCITLSDYSYSQLKAIIQRNYPAEYFLNQKIKYEAFAEKHILKSLSEGNNSKTFSLKKKEY